MNARPKIDLERASILWNSGHTVSDIAERFGTTPDAIVAMACRNRDIFPPKTVARLPEADKLRILLAKTSTRKLADDFGVSTSAIYRKIKRDVLGRAPVGRPKVYHPEIPMSERVVRVTSIGARVTMPRLTFLDGPASERGGMN